MEKIVTTRKVHSCDCCGAEIEKGTEARYYQVRVPKYDNDFCNEDERQIGVEYFKGYLHADSNICNTVIEAEEVKEKVRLSENYFNI